MGGWRGGSGDHDLAMASRWVGVIRHVHLRLLETALRQGLCQEAQAFRALEPVAQCLQQNAQPQVRYKILVLDGLSGMGRTQFTGFFGRTCAGRAGRVKRSRWARKSLLPSVFPASFFSSG